MVVVSVKPLFSILIIFLSLILLTILFSPSTPFSQNFISPFSPRKSEIWSVRRIVEWRPCKWWLEGHLTGLWIGFCDTFSACVELPVSSNGYLRVDCYGGINKMRHDLCDGVGVARLLNAILILPKFEVAVYWNESRRSSAIGFCLVRVGRSFLRFFGVLWITELSYSIYDIYFIFHCRSFILVFRVSRDF
ncbi:hypothetical protein GIB67_011006, partial [Kingdonia uniflora]